MTVPTDEILHQWLKELVFASGFRFEKRWTGTGDERRQPEADPVQAGEALPGFDSLSLTESGENARALKVAFHRQSDERRTDTYGFTQLSDGQRSLIALYCLIFLSNGGRTSLFLDEPDNYLALREIQPWLAAVAEHCGDTLDQAVLVSHHPTTIDYLAGARGRWFFRDANGPVRVSNEPERTVDGISLSETVARGWDRERVESESSCSARTRRRMRSCAGFLSAATSLAATSKHFRFRAGASRASNGPRSTPKTGH